MIINASSKPSTASNYSKEHEVTIIHEYLPNPIELAEKLNDPAVLVLTRTRTKVNEALLQLLPNLKLISQTGKNAGHIDVEACKKYGVAIVKGPWKSNCNGQS